MPSNNIVKSTKLTMFADPKRITYEMIFSGATDMEEREHFSGDRGNDALTIAAAKITEYNNNPNIHHAYVILSRLPDDLSSVGRNILSWTKSYSGEKE